MVLDRGQNPFGTVPAMQLAPAGPVRMNGNGDSVLAHEFVEAVEAVGIWIGTESIDPERFSELKDPLVALVVLGESLNDIGERRYPVLATKSQKCLDLRGRAPQGRVLL